MIQDLCNLGLIDGVRKERRERNAGKNRALLFDVDVVSAVYRREQQHGAEESGHRGSSRAADGENGVVGDGKHPEIGEEQG